MQYLPIFFDIRDKDCLVVGGGVVAYRKANLLYKAGAHLHIVAPEIADNLQQLAKLSAGRYYQRNYVAEDLDKKILVIAATDQREINQQVSIDAKEKGIPINVVDEPELCSFIMGSIVDRSPLMIAVSSSGTSPVLARLLRSRIETMIPSTYGRLAAFVGAYRAKVKIAIKDDRHRRQFWEHVLQGPIAEKVLVGKDTEADQLFEQHLINREEQFFGEVCLVGAGPGDPDLLTFKALRLLQSADVVFYDRLVNQTIVDLARIDAEKIYVGKARSNHVVPQEEINQLLIKYAMQGKRVVRLKGGDPFIFGRGGEEIEGLSKLNIPFQVVPGITAASGCSTYSGIPLTHRDYAQSVRFVTGHLKNNACNLNWTELIDSDQTVVFYMGLNTLDHICQSLIEHGRSEATPIALVEKGTMIDQRVHIGTLKTMPAIVKESDIHAPTLIIVGEVVNLHKSLQWFSPNS